MPIPLLLKTSKETGLTLGTLEDLWNRAKEEAGDDWALVTHIFQGMVKSRLQEYHTPPSLKDTIRKLRNV